MSIVDKQRFKDGHYIGLPANFNDLFVRRRVDIVKAIPDFCGKDLIMADVGCGNGNTLFLLAAEFKLNYGIDLFPENKEVFIETANERNCLNYDFILINIEEKIPEIKFDRIICFETIEHFRNESTVKRLHEMLKPGGMLAVTVPHKWWIFETHGAKLPLLPWNRVPFFSWLPRPMHEKWSNARIYTKTRIVKLLEKSGFEIESASYMTAPLDVLKESAFKSFMLKYVFRGIITRNPFLATNVFVWAKKIS
jgi:2-polyprenyl-3-methyl-5-hydroxy-6-metoxy-1,4-benzoquinol methylase